MIKLSSDFFPLCFHVSRMNCLNIPESQSQQYGPTLTLKTEIEIKLACGKIHVDQTIAELNSQIWESSLMTLLRAARHVLAEVQGM